MEYMRLHYLRLCGEVAKIYQPLEARALALGISVRTAWRLIRYGRRIGMIDTGRHFRVE